MVTAWANWDHGTRVDPDKALRDRDSYAAIAVTGTDAIIIGGTTNVTEANVQPILDALAPIVIPVLMTALYPLPTALLGLRPALFLEEGDLAPEK